MVKWDENALGDLAKAFFAVTATSLAQEQKDAVVREIESYGHETSWDRIRCVETSCRLAPFQRPLLILLFLRDLLSSSSYNFFLLHHTSATPTSFPAKLNCADIIFSLSYINLHTYTSCPPHLTLSTTSEWLVGKTSKAISSRLSIQFSSHL